MCRFLLYMGPPVTLDVLTTRPEYSIIRQSYQSRYAKEPLNGDGFGIAWYSPDVSPEPARFCSIQPAWSSQNLRHLARVTRSEAILAHVRAASSGMSVSETNCHPFTVGRFAFMHNGAIAEFPKLKRRLQQRLSEESFLQIDGNTDSEHLFALFRDRLAEGKVDGNPTSMMADALGRTIEEAVELSCAIERNEPSRLNLVVTDGIRAVVSRYASGAAEAPSLFYRHTSQCMCEEGIFRMVETDEPGPAIVIASEPITRQAGWQPVPQGHMLIVDRDRTVKLRELD